MTLVRIDLNYIKCKEMKKNILNGAQLKQQNLRIEIIKEKYYQLKIKN